MTQCGEAPAGELVGCPGSLQGDHAVVTASPRDCQTTRGLPAASQAIVPPLNGEGVVPRASLSSA